MKRTAFFLGLLGFIALGIGSNAQEVKRVVDQITATTCAANTWASTIAASGAATCTQPATTNLSDFTTGTWTPVVTTTGTVGTPAYTLQVGSYERVGRQVTVRFNVQLSSWTGSPTGNVNISGLPATSNATANDFGVCHIGFYAVTGLAASNFGIGGFVAASSTTILLQSNAATATNSITAAQIGTTTQLVGMCNYHT